MKDSPYVTHSLYRWAAYGVVGAAYISPVVGENYITYLHALIQRRVTGDPRPIDLLEYIFIVSNLRVGPH